MLDEVKVAVNFLGKLMSSTGRVSKDKVEKFMNTLEHHLHKRYTGHWFPDLPVRGSGYRCIRINHKMDPLVNLAAEQSDTQSALRLLPNELTMWIDPFDVSYRIGENGSVGQLLYGSSDIPSKSDLIEPSPEKSKPTSSYGVLSSCKDQLRDFVSQKHGNYVFSPLAAFVTS